MIRGRVALLISALDVNALLARVDLKPLLGQIDVNDLVRQVDMDALVEANSGSFRRTALEPEYYEILMAQAFPADALRNFAGISMSVQGGQSVLYSPLDLRALSCSVEQLPWVSPAIGALPFWNSSSVMTPRSRRSASLVSSSALLRSRRLKMSMSRG